REQYIALAVTSSPKNCVSIPLNHGDETFATATNYTTGNGPSSIATADFNGDGKQDLATAGGGSVSILLGDGNGAFGAPADYGVGANPTSVVARDFNGDGKIDLAVANNSSLNISI